MERFTLKYFDMSEQFLTHLLSYIAAIVVLAIVLKLNYQNFIHKGLVKSRVGNSKISVIDKAFISDTEDQVESIKRLNVCCTYVIAVGVVLFMAMYVSYVFNLFDAVPINPVN